MSVTLQYDEDVSGNVSEECLFSFPKEENFFISTEDALPWRAPDDDDDERMVIASVWIETLLRHVVVPSPAELQSVPFLTRTPAAEWLAAALSELVDNAKLLDTDVDDDQNVRAFASMDELQDHCDTTLLQHLPHPLLTMDDSQNWLNTEDVPAGDAVAWLDSVTLAQLTTKTKNLRAYVDLAKTVGPRARQDRRGGGSQLMVMAGGAMGGQLIQVLKGYYLSPSQATTFIDPLFMANRMEDFFRDTSWPYPYEMAYTEFFEFAFDLTRRAAWHKATKQEWATLVHTILPMAILKLPTMEAVTRDILGQPAVLTREVERLGEASVLQGDDSSKMVFWRLAEVEKEMSKTYADAVEELRAGGRDSTQIVQKIIELAGSPADNDRQTWPPTEGGKMDEAEALLQAPKRGQIKRALAEASYQRLEQAFLDVLQTQGQPDKDVMQLLRDSFQAKSVLPKAVLFQTKGIRIGMYTLASDFLDLIKDERRSLPLYFGQCMAFDRALGKVPNALRTFALDTQEVLKLTNFEWELMDPLNHAILRIQGEMGGSSYGIHDAHRLYHHGDLITKLGQVYGQLFQGMGFPPVVEPDTGLTFVDFVEKLKRLQEFSLSLTDRSLGAWLLKDEPLILRFEETLEQALKVARYRRAMPNIFDRRPAERMYPGFERGNGKKQKEDGGRDGSEHWRLMRDDDKDKGVTKEQTIKLNLRKVFLYDDHSFSMKTRLFNWKGICEHYGWDHEKLCGPVTMTFAKGENREKFCVDLKHRRGCSEHKLPKLQGKPFDPAERSKDLTDLKLITQPSELKEGIKSTFRPRGETKNWGGKLLRQTTTKTEAETERDTRPQRTQRSRCTSSNVASDEEMGRRFWWRLSSPVPSEER
ncbi:MAG: hypothetical protein SGPRY_012250 [Prymnesium sp.]